MSSNSNDDKSSSSSNAAAAALHLQAPRLSANGIGFAAWKERIDVFLQRAGAEDVHKDVMTKEAWIAVSNRVSGWAKDEYNAALALVTGDASLADLTKQEPLTPEVKAARKLVAAKVERSRRVFGIIYAALPDELSAQSAHIAQGHAYGLWHWLETKYQSTEEDTVGELLLEWSMMRQNDEETFDAYRSKVNKLKELLKAAKEEPSPRMYAHILLDRLQPRYKQAVLALKASGTLKVIDKVAWDDIAKFINAHERNESRMDSETQAEGAVAMAATASRSSILKQPREGPRVKSVVDIQCFNCEEYGHFQSNCKKPKKSSSNQERHKPRSGVRFSSPSQKEQVAAALQRRNRYSVLSDEEDEESDSEEDTNGQRIQQSRSVSYAAIVVKSIASSVMQTDVKNATISRSTYTSRSNNLTPVEVPTTNISERTCIPAVREKVEREKALVAASSKSSPPVAATASPASLASRPQSSASARSSQGEKASVSPLAKQRKSPGVGINPEKALATHSFGVDTMASIHISGNKDLFSSLKKCSPVQVQMADGGIVTAAQCGTVQIRIGTITGKTLRVQIDDIYYHERFSANLLSWNVLRQDKWEFHSTHEDTYVITPGGNRIKLLTRGRVSILDSAPPERVYALGQVESATVDALMRLHERLGHMTFKRMVHIMKGNTVMDVTKIHANDHELREAQRRISECRACRQGRGNRTPFGTRGLDVGNVKGETLHMDTYQVALERDGVKWLEYGLTVTDPHTQFRWFSKLTSKDQVAEVVIEIIKLAQTQFSCNVKRIYADGGTEFINRTLKNWVRQHGIELRYTPARTQQLNGVAENAVRSNKDATRTLLVHSGSPLRFWAKAAAHATFVWNRSHVSLKTGITPYESMFGKKPSTRHWGVFGCDVEVHIPKEQRGTFEGKTEPGIYMGHCSTQNCALVYVMRTAKIIASRDVTYMNGKFTLCKALLNSSFTNEIDGDVHGLSDSDSDSDIDEVDQNERRSPTYESDTKSNMESEEQYEVEAVIDERTIRGRKQYLVKWVGYEESTWQPATELEEDAPDVVALFHESRSSPSPQPSPSFSLSSSSSLPTRRRSPREHASSQAIDNEERKEYEIDSESQSESDSDSDTDVTPRVHMAMSAMQLLQSDNDRLCTAANKQIVCAVSAGVSLLEKGTPQSYREAMESPEASEWMTSMVKEHTGCIEQGVFEEVLLKDLPNGTNILPCKWVYRNKTDSNGLLTERKARITPKGFKQKEGQDYFDVFASTGKYKSMRCNLSITARFDHELVQLDIPQAFLNADLEEDVYMEIPEGFRKGKEGYVLRVKKSIYGLKQAPRNWYLMISKFITDQMGFRASVSDPCLYFKRSRSGRLMLIFLFVDDFQCSYHRDDLDEWNEAKSKLVKRFRAKDMGNSEWILGMRITRDRKARTITLDQELYLTKALEKYGYAQCRTAPTPEIVGAAQQEPNEKQDEPTDKQRYMEIVGTLMYAAISTRLDITHAVYYLAAYMLDPRKKHMDAAERVLRYIAGTLSLGLIFGSRNSNEVGESRGHTQLQIDVCAFADADWANNKGDRRSVTGWVAKLNGDPVSWSSKKQRTVALSTCEAELYAEAAAIQEVLWLRGLTKELGLRAQIGSIIHGDNQSAIAVSKNGIKGERTKHVDVKYHFVTETVNRGDIQLQWIPSADQQADIFTKALPIPAFEKLRELLMNY